LPILQEILRMKTTIPNEKVDDLDNLEVRMRQRFEELEASLR
jgi:hypothetical protein